jgi:hypothetical protein
MKETPSSSLELLKIYFWHLNIESLCHTLFNSFCLVYGGPIYTASALLGVNALFNATEQNHFEKLVVSQLVKFLGLYGTQSVHYCHHTCQLSPVLVIPASFCMIHFSILSSVPGFSK